MGGDRELVLGAAMISALFIFALMTWWSILIGVVFWPLTTSVLVQLAKVDPRMRDVATRSLQYKAITRQNPACRAGAQASGGLGNSRSWK